MHSRHRKLCVHWAPPGTINAADVSISDGINGRLKHMMMRAACKAVCVLAG